MLERDELDQLMSFVGRGRRAGETQDSHLAPGESETVTDLISLLTLPEFCEVNNPDLPFEVVARYRGNACGNSIQTVGMA